MSSNAEILQEYLVKIGYQTDAVSYVKFTEALSDSAKKAIGVSTAVAGIGLATAAAVTTFSYNMRKMYFASELANSSVKNLKAMEFAGKQIGISGDAMASSIHSMAQSLRLEPGLISFLESLGVKVSGRDVSDVMIDFVGALKDLPEYQATQIAGMYGISPDEYHLMVTHLDELLAKKQKHLDIQKQMNVDVDAAKESIKEYTGMLDEFQVSIEAVSDKILINMLPSVKKVSKVTTDWLTNLSLALDHSGEEWDKYVDSYSPKHFKQEWQNYKNDMKSFGNDIVDFFMGKGWSASQAAGIAANIQAESSGNPNAVGDNGKAYGLAQWHPDRQKEFQKLFGKPIQQATKEEQLEFIHYELTKGKEGRAGRNLRRARSAREAGEIVSKYYERPADREGQAAYRGGLAEKILGADTGRGGQVNINQTNEYNITGSDPRQIADSVSQKQDRTWGNITRRFNQVVQ